MISSFIHLLLAFILPASFIFFCRSVKRKEKSPSFHISLPKAYPLIGSYFSMKANQNNLIQWLSHIIQLSPTATFTLHGPFANRKVITGNPANVHHILKTHFSNYQKGTTYTHPLSDFLGAGILNVDGETWRFQRQLTIHEFTTKPLRKFVEHVVYAEISNRLIPILTSAASEDKTLDFQDILQRFTFDNICKITIGFDPEDLTPSTERSKFVQAFDEATEISGKRLQEPLPLIWKIKRVLNIGSEKRLKMAVSEVHQFVKKRVREKKRELKENSSLEYVDMLSRILISGNCDENVVTDRTISFILAGKDSTSVALTWLFWLISKNPRVEKEIVKEIMEKPEDLVYDEVKEMVYTHAALCESMRLYPPVPMDTKEAVNDDVLPDGTVVKKGTMMVYHVYAMGRMESIWGGDWREFRPERWLEKKVDESGKWRFLGRDCFCYPVFQAGPRVCLGKEMAFMQMKTLVAGILRRFRVVPAVAEGVDPPFISFLTSQMAGGFPVTIRQRFPSN
ncbi:hypothetical protein RJT34_18829 [Clitoria ternatea]|uniref:Cytochrome P450 n=1 Tax=Clitoria ternatea TaxID=43366 RepID=A0AAN9P2S1_CLITE